mmetsp:Transcript_12681/g.12516  ORF Transcript_12681/g.12516 Transcript_12681/m.12516 type:complete len:121 (+) Transcript_12681:527-889(+)
MKIEDIDGTKPKKVYVRESNYDSFNYFDITKTKFTSSRTINPLMPTYQVKDEQNNLIQIGEIPGSSPKKMPMRTLGNYFQQLHVRDIPGTATGSRGLGPFHSRERKDFRQVNNISDVPGA